MGLRDSLKKVEKNAVRPGGRLKRIRKSAMWMAPAFLVMSYHPGLAQNAAQRAALARMMQPQANTAPASGVEATSVPLNQPGGLAFDAAGNLYIADTNDNIVHEVNLSGIISTVAGDGEQGFGGDGGAATSALLDSPAGVAVDASGNIYIADTHNNRIREVSSGVIHTIAGTGAAGFSGDGGAAASASLNYPTSVAADASGNVYIADTNNSRIREIVGGVIGTRAGNGQQTYSGDGGPATAAGLDSPNGVAVDASFNLYIADTHNQRVRMVANTTGIVTTIAGTGAKAFTGDGAASGAALARPRGVAVDASGTLYVADSDNDRVRTISGDNITTVAGDGTEGDSGDSGPSTQASLDTPRAVAASGGATVFSDTLNNRVRAVNAGVIDTIAGLAPTTAESLTLGSEISIVYGTGSLTATFSNNGVTGAGLVTFYDGTGAGPATIGSTSLTSNSATVSTATLSAGTHSIVASYAGDANNPAIVSGVYVLTIAPAQLTAIAGSVNLLYGQAIPTLTGTLTGVLAQDSGNVTAVFTTRATNTSAPGTYPISVALSGSAAGNYAVTMGSSYGSLVIAQAPSATTFKLSNATPIFGTSVTLTAAVASTTSGTPSGTVNFYNGATLLNSTPAPLNAGVAAISITTLPVGTLGLTAVYSGSTDFSASTSSLVTGQDLSPDFTIATTPATQIVVPTQGVSYAVTLTPLNPTFLYPVSLSASGLPGGVTATFTPSSIAAGTGTSTVTLTLDSNAQASLQRSRRPFHAPGLPTVLALLSLPLAFNRRFRKSCIKLSGKSTLLIALLALAVVSAISGCGGGGFFGQSSASYTVTVTAVSGPATHSSTVTLTVQ